jgi:hypothetical protein
VQNATLSNSPEYPADRPSEVQPTDRVLRPKLQPTALRGSLAGVGDLHIDTRTAVLLVV